MPPPNIARPRDLREALGLAFVQRTNARWRAGSSALLDVTYDGAGAPQPIDVADVVDFHTVRSDRHGLAIGAFAAPDVLAHSEIARALGAARIGPYEARFRLGALGARVVIAGPGATRETAFLDFPAAPLPAHEIPVAVTLRDAPQAIFFGDRRIKRKDGAASFELRVHVALAIAAAHRVRHATIAHAIDGGPPIGLPTVAAQLDGNVIGRTTFADTARRAADLFRGDDERTSALRRTIIPLLLSALNDAYASARASQVDR